MCTVQYNTIQNNTRYLSVYVIAYPVRVFISMLVCILTVFDPALFTLSAPLS